MVEEPPDPGSKPFGNKGLYDQMLDQVRELAQQAVLRLRSLSNLLPTGVIEQVEHLHEDPVHERRETVRFNDSPIPVTVEEMDSLETAMKDHSPKGMAILLPVPVW